MLKIKSNMSPPITLYATRSANMKILVCFAALTCAILFVQSTDSSAGKSGAGSNGSNEDPSCATPNPASGYASPLKLPNSKREIKVYNVDYVETRPHKPVCLSKMADDTMLWASGSSKKFKIKIYAAKNQDPHCEQHPFLKAPPTETVDGYFSGSLKPTVPNFCEYEVEFQLESGQVSDPHIRTGP